MDIKDSEQPSSLEEKEENEGRQYALKEAEDELDIGHENQDREIDMQDQTVENMMMDHAEGEAPLDFESGSQGEKRNQASEGGDNALGVQEFSENDGEMPGESYNVGTAGEAEEERPQFENQDRDVNLHDDEYLYDLEITRRVEQEKLNQIQMASDSLRHNLSHFQGRCEICTLVPPCKHKAASTARQLDQNQYNSNGQDSLFDASINGGVSN